MFWPCSLSLNGLRTPEGATKKLRSNIRRSTETGIAVEMRSRVTRQGSRESTDGSTNSNSSEGAYVHLTIWFPAKLSAYLPVPASLSPLLDIWSLSPRSPYGSQQNTSEDLGPIIGSFTSGRISGFLPPITLLQQKGKCDPKFLLSLNSFLWLSCVKSL